MNKAFVKIIKIPVKFTTRKLIRKQFYERLLIILLKSVVSEVAGMSKHQKFFKKLLMIIYMSGKRI